MPAKSNAPIDASAEGKAKAAVKSARSELYAARQFLGRDTQARLDLRLPFDVYFQDPFVTGSDPAYNFDEEFVVPWEPGLDDGPTSARFAVVDYDGGTEVLNPPARWDADLGKFVDGNGKVLDRHNLELPAVPPDERLGDAAERARLLRKRLRSRPPYRLGVRRQPPHRGAARRLWRERLLRPGQQIAAVLLLRPRRAGRAQAHSYLPFRRHHQSRVRPCRARRHSPALPRIRLCRDGGLPRVPRRHRGDPDRLPQQRVPRADRQGHPRRPRHRQSALQHCRGVRQKHRR